MILAALRFDALDENKSVSVLFSLVFSFYNCGRWKIFLFTHKLVFPKKQGGIKEYDILVGSIC